MNDTGSRRLDLDCGISRARICEWLERELGLPRMHDRWLMRTDAGICAVALEDLEARRLGSFELERTRLVADGPSGAVAIFERLFTLRFMSAGG